jgi:hypothetical protein
VADKIEAPSALPRRRSRQYTFDRRLGGPQSRCGCSGNDNNLAQTGSNPPVQHARFRYTKCTAAAHEIIGISKKLQGAEHFLRSRHLYSYLSNFRKVIEPKHLFPCSQEPSNGAYAKPEHTSLNSSIHLNISTHLRFDLRKGFLRGLFRKIKTYST